MEKELAKMRASLSESVQLMEQREMNTNIECVYLYSLRTISLSSLLFSTHFQSCSLPFPLSLLTHYFFRYEQLTLRANALREELHTEIERMLNDIIKFKVHIQKSLEDYEGFVVEEVEGELGTVDAEVEEPMTFEDGAEVALAGLAG